MPMDKSAMEIAVKAKVDLLYHKAIDHFNIETDKPVPAVKFDLHGQVAGMAQIHKHLLRYNSYMLEHNFYEFLSQVVPHEVAHIVAHLIDYNTTAHGNIWKQVMRFYGCEPVRCHNFSTEPITKRIKRVAVTCTGCGHIYHITPKKWLKITSPRSQASCSICRAKIDSNAPHEIKILNAGN
jgi:SprT protein